MIACVIQSFIHWTWWTEQNTKWKLETPHKPSDRVAQVREATIQPQHFDYTWKLRIWMWIFRATFFFFGNFCWNSDHFNHSAWFHRIFDGRQLYILAISCVFIQRREITVTISCMHSNRLYNCNSNGDGNVFGCDMLTTVLAALVKKVCYHSHRSCIVHFHYGRQ